MDRKINENIIKIVGSANINELLTIGNEYTVAAKVSCEEKQIKNNNDGTVNNVFKLYLQGQIAVKNSEGKQLISKDKNSNSKKLRNQIWAIWNEKGLDIEFENYYDAVMQKIRSNLNAIVDKL